MWMYLHVCTFKVLSLKKLSSKLTINAQLKQVLHIIESLNSNTETESIQLETYCTKASQNELIFETSFPCTNMNNKRLDRLIL